MGGLGLAIDRSTQAWVRATGRVVDLSRAVWLDGPTGAAGRIAHEWVAAEAHRLSAETSEGGGLLSSFDALASDTCDVTRVAQPIVEFYERTSGWRLDVRTQWSPIAMPAGWLVSSLFARRLQQLALPLRSLDVAHGMDSRIIRLCDDTGEQLGAAWLRTLRSTGHVIYSGFYSVMRLPDHAFASIRVVFPLPNGSLTVFLRPSVEPDGGFVLASPIGEFGDDGAYLIVRDGTRVWVRRVPLDERFRVYVDSEGTLRTDHVLNLWNMRVLQFRYRLTPNESFGSD